MVIHTYCSIHADAQFPISPYINSRCNTYSTVCTLLRWYNMVCIMVCMIYIYGIVYSIVQAWCTVHIARNGRVTNESNSVPVYVPLCPRLLARPAERIGRRGVVLLSNQRIATQETETFRFKAFSSQTELQSLSKRARATENLSRIAPPSPLLS